MATDRRRNNGPDNSMPPLVLKDTDWAQTFSSSGAAAKPAEPARQSPLPRPDGRGADAVRPIFLQCGLIEQGSGSAYLEAGQLKLACAVYGPRQVRGKQYTGQGELNVDVRYAPFASSRRKRPGKDAESSTVSELVHAALLPALRLDLLPKASIDVFITVLEADAPEEGTVAAAVTAASTALAQAGIEMYGLVAGVAGLFVGQTADLAKSIAQQPLFLTDPTAGEAASPFVRGTLQLCAMPALGSVTSLRQLISHGTDYEVIDAAVEKLMAKSTEVHYVMADALSKHFDRSSE